MGKIFVIYVELCMKWTLLSILKGNNSCKNLKKNIILESSRKHAYGILKGKMA